MNRIPLNSLATGFLPRTGLSILFGVALALSSALASAAENLQVKNEIIDLMLCYGKGTDTFGVASNPNAFYDGLAIYEECFTEDAVFNLWPPGFDVNQPAPITVVGPAEWAIFVDEPLDGNSLGQHMLTNFMVETKGNTGELTAYLAATRAFYAGGLVTSVVVANGTYTLQVEKIGKKWMVRQLDLKLISFVEHYSAD